jgi:ABC-type transport system substrate-binding protein
MAGTFLVSCQQKQPDAGKESDRPIRLRLNSFALTLHPLKMADVESRRVATLLYAGLIAQEQDGTVRPLIAKSWERKGKEWVFELQPGVTFTNGTPVRAEDVAASLCAAMQPNSPLAWALLSVRHRSSVDGKAVECIGLLAEGSRVHITEEQSVPWLLDALSGPAGWIMPAQGAKEGAYSLMPGAGPYKVKEIVPDVRVVLEAREGSPVTPGAKLVQFDYIPDDSVAANAFASGKLDELDLSSPQLVELIADPSARRLKYPGSLSERTWDRVRVAIINEKSLAAKGFKAPQVRKFIDALSASVDRDRIASLSHGTGQPLYHPFLPVADTAKASTLPVRLDLPEVKLTIITESDPYSDLIAASLPKTIDKVLLDYKGVDKGILLDSIIKGNFDIASLLIEAPVHSPRFWASLFTPGNPFTAFGKPIDGMQKVNLLSDEGLAQAGRLIAGQGNWVAILRERRLHAVATGISNIIMTPSGQTNYAFIKRAG